MKISLRQVRAFEAAAATGSFTDAAERLNLTQSAVSMLIRNMEDTLGLPLFVRTGRGVELTEFGAEARPNLTRALAELEEVSDAARGLSDLRRGHLRLALPQILATAWLPRALAAYREAHASVRIEIADTVTDRVAAAVAANDAELGIGPERTVPPEIEATPVWEVPLRIAITAGSAIAQAPCLTEREMRNLSWIHYSDEFSRMLESTILAHRGARRPQDLRVRSLSTALSLLGQGEYATAAPAYAEVFAPLFGVTFRDLPNTPTKRRFMLFARKNRPLSPAAEAFRALILTWLPAGATPFVDTD